MDPTDTSFPVRSLNTFDNAAYQAERRVAREKQLHQMQEAFSSTSNGRDIVDDTISLNTTQSSPAAFSNSSSTTVRRARDLVTDLYSNKMAREEHQNLAPARNNGHSMGMQDVEIQSSHGNTSSKVHMDGGICVACWYSVAHAMGFVMEATVACWSRKTRTQKMLILLCLVLIPVLVTVIAVLATSNNSSSSSSMQGDIPPIQAKPINEERHVLIRSKALEISSELDLDTFGTPSNLALRWLVDYDKAELNVDHDGLMQRYVLAVLFFATSVLQQEGNTVEVVQEWDNNWMSQQGICLWWGVACPSIIIKGKSETQYNDNTAVVQLNLTAQELTGSLPSELRALENLQSLDLSVNKLGGSIPTGLGRLREMETLFLRNNRLTGFLPSELGNFRKLKHMHFGNNHLEGPVPTEISALRELESIGLDQNYFSGTLPYLSNFVKLRKLYLDNNAFSGTIPADFENLDSLVDLRLGKNYLVGSIPSVLFKMPLLELLHLDENDLAGNVPDLFGQAGRLSQVHLYKNKFTGTLPPSIGDLPVLRELHVDNNQFSGSIPPTFGNLDDLETLYANGNDLTGLIPSNIAGMKNLKDLRLYRNGLSGMIPENISKVFRIETLFVHNNFLDGTIPSSIGLLDRLESFRFYKNDLFGTVPEKLCNVKSLQYIAGDCNQEKGGSLKCDCCHECYP